MWARKPSRNYLGATRYKTRYVDVPQGPGEFNSKWGLVLSCLGCVVGTGNIWRFPRIVANNSGNDGCLQFLIAWVLFLFIWSIPIILIEYAVGRYTRKSTVRSFRILIGPWSSWCGAWMTAVNTLISCYYSVILGWCIYYLYHSTFYALPTDYSGSKKIFTDFQNTKWPILFHFLSISLAGLSIVKSVKSIELVNKIVVPLLLIIVVMSFAWALTLKSAGRGITYLFSPDWEKMTEPKLWVDAASQNAWDTGAGVGLFLTYATFMTRNNSVVKIGFLLPLCNNLISLICCITTFATVFSVEMDAAGPKSKADILLMLKNNGPANTGLTFIWMPRLYHSLGASGRALCVFFFLCLSLAGLSSLISTLELAVHTLQDMRVDRKFALPIVMLAVFCGGIPSAISQEVLVNQDFVWGFALVLAGSATLSIPIRYGVSRFRWEIVNDFGFDDWTLPGLWELIVKYLAPLEAIALFAWWIVDTVRDNRSNKAKWYTLGQQTLISAFLQWFIVLALLISINGLWMRWRRSRPLIYVTTPRSYGATQQTPPVNIETEKCASPGTIRDQEDGIPEPADDEERPLDKETRELSMDGDHFRF